MSNEDTTRIRRSVPTPSPDPAAAPPESPAFHSQQTVIVPRTKVAADPPVDEMPPGASETVVVPPRSADTVVPRAAETLIVPPLPPGGVGAGAQTVVIPPKHRPTVAMPALPDEAARTMIVPPRPAQAPTQPGFPVPEDPNASSRTVVLPPRQAPTVDMPAFAAQTQVIAPATVRTMVPGAVAAPPVVPAESSPMPGAGDAPTPDSLTTPPPDDDRYKRAMALFNAAAELALEERRRFVDAEAADDAWVRNKVYVLLERYEAFSPAGDEPKGTSDDFLVGTELGDVRVTKRLGQAGIGDIYLATRGGSPVIVEVVNTTFRPPDVDDWTDRDAWMALSHPNVARVLDAGTLSDGRPYLVTEFVVDGRSVTAYCDEKELPIDARLTLFQKVCAGVDALHRRAMLHGDLSPSNVCVGASGEAKVLHAGFGRFIVQGSAADRTRPGSPEASCYASPERLRGELTDTTADVFSLGVLLCELVSGDRPWVEAQASQRSARAVPPLVPSRSLAGQPGEGVLPAVERARLRGTTPDALSALLAGGLDAVIATAVAHRPVDRHQSVRELARAVTEATTPKAPPMAAVPAPPPPPVPVAVPVPAKAPVAAGQSATPATPGAFLTQQPLVAAAVGVVLLAMASGLALSLTSWRSASAAAATAAERDQAGRAYLLGTLDKVAGALDQVPDTTEVRRELVQTATTYLRQAQAQAGSDAAVLRDVAAGYARLADLQGTPGRANLGDAQGAARNLDHALKLFEYVKGRLPRDPQVLAGLVRAQMSLGALAEQQGDAARARAAYEAATKALVEGQGVIPGDQTGVPTADAIAQRLQNLQGR
ncbi:MAG: protein kinase [Vicinamibacterales bacterium]